MKSSSVPADAVKALPANGWLVGGAVRDSILGRPVTDIDLVAPGDPEAAARAFADTVGKVAVLALTMTSELGELFTTMIAGRSTSTL